MREVRGRAHATHGGCYDGVHDQVSESDAWQKERRGVAPLEEKALVNVRW